MKRRLLSATAVVILLVAATVFLFWKSRQGERAAEPVPVPTVSQSVPRVTEPTAGEKLLKGYGDDATPPIEDLKMLHRVMGGYFSVIKDPYRFPIGGNEDLAAALRGENPNREIFVPAGHRLFSKDGLVVDRWGTPLQVHPEGWRQVGFRSAGPDRKLFTEDDLVLLPGGMQPSR